MKRCMVEKTATLENRVNINSPKKKIKENAGWQKDFKGFPYMIRHNLSVVVQTVQTKIWETELENWHAVLRLVSRQTC